MAAQKRDDSYSYHQTFNQGNAQTVTATAQIRSKASSISSLEALSVNDGGSALVIFLFRDPHLLEG